MYKGGNTNNPVVNYVIKHRHYSSSCILVTQAYKVSFEAKLGVLFNF